MPDTRPLPELPQRVIDSMIPLDPNRPKPAEPARCITFDRVKGSLFAVCRCGHSTDEHTDVLGPCETCPDAGSPSRAVA